MIIFKYVRWRNFLSTGNAFTEFDLTKNKSTLVIGENGAGKSTVLDALSFGLYGKPFRKVNKPQLINSINGKGLEVEVEFSIGKREYKIRRCIKPNAFEIFHDGNLINQDSASSEYQEYLEKNILKLNHKSFCQIVVLGSASFVPFMQLTAQNRREVIEELLDIQIFSTMNSLLKEKLADNRNNLTNSTYSIDLLGQKIEMHKKHLEEINKNNDDIIAQKTDKIAELVGEISTASTEVNKLLKELKTKSDSISDQDKVTNKIQKLDALRSQLKHKISKIEKDIEFFNDHNDCPTCQQGIDHEHKALIVKQDNEQLLEVISGVEKLDEELNALKTRLGVIAEVLKEITACNSRVSNLNVEINTKSGFVEGLKSEINTLKTSVKVEDNSEELKQFKIDLRAAIAEKESLIADKQILDIASNLLRDSGIKTKIIKQYVPIMLSLIHI